MKNKIIAFLLAVLTVATSVMFVVPAAAEEPEVPKYELAAEDALRKVYSDVQTKLNAEIAAEYTELFTENDNYALYANKYTGEIYLKNKHTNQFLTSNPVTLVGSQDSKKDQLSQVWLTFTEVAGTKTDSYNSFDWAAEAGQIEVKEIDGGISVEYAIGEIVVRYAAPEAITKTDFLNSFIYPFQNKIFNIYQNLEELAPTIVAQINETGNKKDNDKKYPYNKADYAYTGDRDDINAFEKYLKDKKSLQSDIADAYKEVYNKVKNDPSSDGYQQLLAELKKLGAVSESATTLPTANTFSSQWARVLDSNFRTMLGRYDGCIDPNTASADEIAAMREKYPIIDQIDPVTGKYYVVYYLKGDASSKMKRSLQTIFAELKPGYNVDQMLAHEAKVGIEYVEEAQPVFYCTIRYTLDETGLTYSMPASSITYDETKYRLTDFSILRYFGANIVNSDKSTDQGYVFFPDGSGALLYDRDLTRKSTISNQKIYGYDYAYRKIVGENTQSIRLPVYGAVDFDENGIGNGYFAVITEGDSLAKLTVSVSADSYLVAYQSYDLRPSDTYTTSDITVEIPIYSKQWYTGNYTTKVYMLTDPVLASAVTAEGYTYYRADYVGMADAYRHYLVNVAQTLTALDASELESRLPLYIESFGFLETQEKFLTFPVNVDVALTTFKDVEKMHTELSTEGISNIKFRLSGFINGGYEALYPQRLKFNKAVGGKDGYKALLKYASQQADTGMEVFLSVDLMYNYTPGKFGTPSAKKTLARSMDNRYTSRQTYDTVYQGFFSHFSMVVSANKLESLFNKFNKKLSKYNADAIALDYMAEHLSSNYNEDNTIDRESAKNSVVKALKTISSKYASVMSTGGNAYALQYVDYLLDAPVDSSRYIFASRTVPFYGIVLHGYTQYAGGAFNETGSPDYELLRAIESGASMYYILSYRNTDLIKEDKTLNEHYSANYEIWKEDLVTYYNTLDYAIGDLQTWTIVDHKFLSGERIVTAAERAADLATLEAEYLAFLRDTVSVAKTEKGAYVRRLIAMGEELESANAIVKRRLYTQFAGEFLGNEEEGIAPLDETVAALIRAKVEAESLTEGNALKALVEDGTVNLSAGQKLNVTFDKAAILANAKECFDCDVSAGFEAELDRLIAELSTSGTIAVNILGVENYEEKTAHSFFTSSNGDDASYEATDYTLSDGSIVLVTYGNGTQTVRLLLNFSVFDVKVKLDGVDYSLTKYDFVRLDARADGVTDPRKGE